MYSLHLVHILYTVNCNDIFIKTSSSLVIKYQDITKQQFSIIQIYINIYCACLSVWINWAQILCGTLPVPRIKFSEFKKSCLLKFLIFVKFWKSTKVFLNLRTFLFLFYIVKREDAERQSRNEKLNITQGFSVFHL